MGSISITEALVENYIKCTKIVTKSPRKEYIEQAGSRRNQFSLKAVDEDWSYEVFIRQLIRFPDHFTVGLKITNSPVGEITLLRCNGPHGSTRNGSFQYEHHEYPHLHINDNIAINGGNLLKPAFREITKDFFNLSTGIIYFCRICNIVDFEKYFNFDKQLSFLEEKRGD